MKTTGRDDQAADVRVHEQWTVSLLLSGANSSSGIGYGGTQNWTLSVDASAGLLGLLASHLPEGRPLFLLLHVRVVAGVLGVVAGVAVRVEKVGRAQFVDRGQRNAGCVPETHGAVLVSVEAQREKYFCHKIVLAEANWVDGFWNLLHCNRYDQWMYCN